MTNKIQGKRELFTQRSKNKLPLFAGAVFLLAAVIFLVVVVFGGSGPRENDNYFGQPVAASRSYLGKVIAMTDLEPIIEDGKVQFSLAEVEQNDIVFFEVLNNEGELVPLMAYITPSGRLFVGSSMCEPCRGRKFSLAGETLLCDACRTTYDIETHAFLSGAAACGAYPPVNMNPRVENGIITINLADVLNWRIRS